MRGDFCRGDMILRSVTKSNINNSYPLQSDGRKSFPVEVFRCFSGLLRTSVQESPEQPERVFAFLESEQRGTSQL